MFRICIQWLRIGLFQLGEHLTANHAISKTGKHVFVHPEKHRERKQTEENDGCDAGAGVCKNLLWCNLKQNRRPALRFKFVCAVQLIVGSRYQTMQVGDGTGRQLVGVCQGQVCAGGAVKCRESGDALRSPMVFES